MTAPRCPTRNCESRTFWRLIDSNGDPVYPSVKPICLTCHPSGYLPGQFIEIVNVEEQ